MLSSEQAGDETPKSDGSAADGNSGETSGNKVNPDTRATGPHTTWKTDPDTGEITRHETWTPNEQNPTGWDSTQSTDIEGKSHFNKKTGESVPTPHTQGKGIEGGVRPAKPSEIPASRRGGNDENMHDN